MLLNAKLRRAKVPSATGRTLVNVRLLNKDLAVLDEFIAAFRKETKTKLTRSYMLRNGAFLLMTKMKRQLTMARKGELHAKKRKDV